MRKKTTNIIDLCRPLTNIFRDCIGKIIFCFVCFLFHGKINAQQTADSTLVDVSKVQSSEIIQHFVFYTTYKKNDLPDTEISKLNISTKIPVEFEKRIPLEITGKNIYIRFALYNGADTAVTFYFSPGSYCKKMDLFKRSLNEPDRPLSRVGKFEEGFTGLTLQPKERAQFVARLDYIMTTITTLSPAIVKKDFISYFRFQQDNNIKGTYVKLLNYMTAGILLMMIFYSIAVFLQSYNIEFIYYAIYASCMALLLSLKSYLFGKPTDFNYFFEGFFDFVIQMTGYYFYLLFFRKFLNTKTDHPFLEKVFRSTGWIIALSLVVFVLLYLLSGEFSMMNLVENVKANIADREPDLYFLWS